MIHTRIRIGFAAAALLAVTATVQANEFEQQLKTLAKSDIQPWLANPELVAAIKAQNVRHASLSQADIDGLDKQWQSEIGAGSKPLIQSVAQAPLSKFLAAKKDESQGLFTEVFVMDSKGLNVGLSDVTSDYWQGDEPKWQKTFLAGPDAIHIADVRKDESTQSYQSQVSLPVTDPESHKVIGAITVGVNVEMLAH